MRRIHDSAVMALACCAALGAQPASRPASGKIQALERSPWLADVFPYGFWLADAPHLEELAKDFGEPYAVRRGKLFHDLARHHINAIFPANRAAVPSYLGAAHRYGLRAATMPLFLYQHVDNAGKLRAKDLDWVKAQWPAHAVQIRDHPALLAYHVFDEPHPTVAPKIREITDLLQKTDPGHPVVFTHQNVPLGNAGWQDEWRLLESLPVLLSDMYSVQAYRGRDPWLYGDTTISELRRVNSDALSWPIVQAFAYRQLPSPEELRVIVYHTIAQGAKGMFFFTAEQCYVSWSRRHRFFHGAGNAWFGREALFEEIGRIGAHVTTAGPLLIPLRHTSDYPVYVAGPASASVEPETFQAYVRGPLRPAGEIQRPAIHVGAFCGQDYDILVVHNDDPWRAHGASVTLGFRREVVADLATCKRVNLAEGRLGATFPVRLEPGDGRLYFAGDESALGTALAAVLRRRCEHQARMLRLDAEQAEAGGADVTTARELLQRAGSALGAGAADAAMKALDEGQAALREAESAAASYAAARQAVESARRDFDRIDRWFRSAPIQPKEKGAAPSLVELEERVFSLSRRFCAIENATRGGNPDAPAAEALQADVAELKEAVLTYRPPNRAEGSIAVIAFGGAEAETGGPELRALATRLQWLFEEVRTVTARPDGELLDGGGRRVDLAEFDTVWFHVGGRSAAARVQYCVSASLLPGIPHTRVIAALRGHLESGGGVVLSGLATQLVTQLGLEAFGPNHCYWGPMVVPGHGPSRHRSAAPDTKALGLKPLVQGHPLFAGLPAEGFETMSFDAAELVTEALWRRPPGAAECWRRPWWPEKGRVVAGYWADGLVIPANHATVVEYRLEKGGKALLLGGAFDPRVNNARSRRGESYDHFLRNVVAFLSRAR